jgi:hypothetical protein
MSRLFVALALLCLAALPAAAQTGISGYPPPTIPFASGSCLYVDQPPFGNASANRAYCVSTGAAGWAAGFGLAPITAVDGTTITINGSGVISAIGGGGSLTLSDGVHTVTGTTQIVASGAIVGGATPNATLTVPIATTATPGSVQPDGTSIIISGNVISTAAGGGNVTGSGAATAGDVMCVTNTTTPLNSAVDCGFGPTLIDPTVTGTVSVTQWNNAHALLVSTSGQTVSLLASAGYSRNGSITIQALSSLTLHATGASDVIADSAGTTGGGGSITIPAGALVVVSSPASGTFSVAGNSVSGGGGLTVGTTTIASGTPGDIEFNNSGVLGEKPVTGTGAVVLANSPALTGTATAVNLTVTGSCTGCSGTGSATVIPPQGRLTLQSHTPILSLDVSGATTIYYDSFAGGAYPNFSGSADVTITIAGNEISDVIGSAAPSGVVANQVVDEWALATGVLCHATDGAGHGWSSDTGGSNTARGTGYSQIDATTRYYVTNKNALSNCYNGSTNEGTVAANQATYLGSFWTLQAAGAVNMVFQPAAITGGSAPCLCLFNAYNRVPMTSRSADAGPGWHPNGSAAWGPINVGATGLGLNERVSWVDGQGVVPVVSESQLLFDQASANGTSAYDTGIDFDSSSAAPSPLAVGVFRTAAATFLNFPLHARSQLVGTGAHFAQAVEYSSGATSVAFVVGATTGAAALPSTAIWIQGAF